MFIGTAMEKAYLVLDRVMMKHKLDDKGLFLSLGAFANCREQGFSLSGVPDKGTDVWQVCFSENRNSDEIVVYYGKPRDFDISTNTPITDEGWGQKKYFSHDQYDQAADFILEFLNTGKVDNG